MADNLGVASSAEEDSSEESSSEAEDHSKVSTLASTVRESRLAWWALKRTLRACT